MKKLETLKSYLRFFLEEYFYQGGVWPLSNTSMLSIKELNYAFKGTAPIFKHLKMEVKPGEFVSVIGASGSGKSTLFKLITGLLEPDQGEVNIDGQDTKKD